MSVSLVLLLAACGGGGGSSDDGGGPPTVPSNQRPSADLSASPSSGNAPLEVSIDLSCSDPDGSIQESRLDADGDGSFERSSSSSSIRIDTTYRTEETVTVAGQCVDDDAAESSEATQNVSVEVITRTIQIQGASPEPGEGLVPVAGAYVITGLKGEAARDTVQADSNGEAVIEPVKEEGAYKVVVRDELDSGLGDWFDIANPDTTPSQQVTGDTDEQYVLFPVVSLHPQDTFYRNSVHWWKEVQGRNNLGNTARGMPEDGGAPYRVFVDPDSALAGQVEAAKEGGSSWNGPDGNYDNVTFVDSEADADYTVVFTESGSSTTGGDRRVSITRTTNTEATKEITAHEFSHVFFNINEETSHQGLYASDPTGNTFPPDPLEIRNFQAAKVLVRNFGRVSYPFIIYAEE